MMRLHYFASVVGCLLGLAATAASAQDEQVVGPLERFARHEARFFSVPPDQEIEILDPNADPMGRPAVELVDGEEGITQVDIPQVILVHRFYYTGDRSFQGPMLPGGPSIIVVNHPRTGERTYVPVQMLPGSPRVTYCGRSIKYDFGERCVTLHFGILGEPSVRYDSQPNVKERVYNAATDNRLTRAASGAGSRLKGAWRSTHNGVSKFATAASTPFVQLGQFVPFAKALQRTPEQKAFTEADRFERERERARAVEERLAAEATIPRS